MTESSLPSGTRDALLEAAAVEFATFGYRRSSMESVARRAGLSRATLYSHWSSKEQLVRTLVESLHAQHLTAMRDAIGRRQGDTAQQIADVLEARFAGFVALTASSPNARELYDIHDRICGDIAARARDEGTELIEQFLEELADAGSISFASSGLNAHDAAKALTLSAEAAKGENRDADPATFRADLQRIVRLLVHGLKSTSPAG